MTSQRRKSDLVRRVRVLAATFLPPPSATGSYSLAQYDQTSAFLLMCHAEIESYIETRCLQLVHQTVSAWLDDSKPRTTILSLAAFSNAGGTTGLTIKAKKKPDTKAIVQGAKRRYSDVVYNNHGLKEENLEKMLLPLGIQEDELAPLLPDMNSFGLERGNLAHKSVGSTKSPDPVDSRILVTRILRDMRTLDRRLTELGSE